MIKVMNNFWFNSKLGIVTIKIQKKEFYMVRHCPHKSNLKSLKETGITESIPLFL